MEPSFDAKGLAADLAVFTASILMHLTDDRPVPTELAERLWTAYDAAASVLEDLKRHHGVSRG
jgi:hypothetical protein